MILFQQKNKGFFEEANAKEVIDRSVLLRLHDEMPKFLQNKGFQIERGKAGSVAVHKGVKKYRSDMEKEKAA